jgi:hypothetical protein
MKLNHELRHALLMTSGRASGLPTPAGVIVRRVRRIAIIALLAAALASESPAYATTASVSRISGPSPISSCNPANDITGMRGYEHQASLEIDPKDPRHLASPWTQDFDDATVVAFSRNAGASWQRVPVPGQMPGCGGDPEDPTFDSAVNPRASIGPDGTVYVISNVYSSNTRAQAVRINSTRDDGVSWIGSTTLEAAPSLDWVWVTADPKTAGTATALWGHRVADATSVTSAWEYVARTTDFGAHWMLADKDTHPVPPAGKTYQFGQLVALPDRSLVDVFAECDTADQCKDSNAMTVHAARSSDGSVWSAPGDALIVGEWFDVALTPGGSLLVASVRDTTIELVRSGDLGASWQPAVTVVAGGAYADATVAALSDGTVGVLYYERVAQNDTVVRLTTSRDGTSWTTRDLAGPFDESAAPALGKGMGEWLGLVPVGKAFAAVFPMAATRTADPNQQVQSGATDVFLATVPAR